MNQIVLVSKQRTSISAAMIEMNENRTQIIFLKNSWKRRNEKKKMYKMKHKYTAIHIRKCGTISRVLPMKSDSFQIFANMVVCSDVRKLLQKNTKLSLIFINKWMMVSSLTSGRKKKRKKPKIRHFSKNFSFWIVHSTLTFYISK